MVYIDPTDDADDMELTEDDPNDIDCPCCSPNRPAWLEILNRFDPVIVRFSTGAIVALDLHASGSRSWRRRLARTIIAERGWGDPPGRFATTETTGTGATGHGGTGEATARPPEPAPNGQRAGVAQTARSAERVAESLPDLLLERLTLYHVMCAFPGEVIHFLRTTDPGLKDALLFDILSGDIEHELRPRLH